MNDAARADALLTWFAAAQRSLPWRQTPPDPYATLVSELMLQQTRVDTVVPYFHRWMARWPDLASLAAATLDEVRAAWTGLGYYNRARNLHRAAQAVVARHGGQLPADPAALAALPGVGPYTLGAVRSIGFGQPAALVDGNVARVLSRWFALDAPPASGAGRRALWARAESLLQVPAARAAPSEWNQGLMELGALVCTPKAPLCDRCPVAPWCLALAQGRVAELPTRTPKKRATPVAAAYLLLVRDGAVWCGQRPERGRWAGLWEPPAAEGPDAHAALARTLPMIHDASALPPLTHTLTHRRYTVTPYLLDLQREPPDLSPLGYTASRWVSPDEAAAASSGLSRLAQKLVATISAR